MNDKCLSTEETERLRRAPLDWNHYEPEALDDMVVFARRVPDEQTAGGLWKPETTQRTTYHVVVAVGPDVADLAPGDCVSISEAAILDPACHYIREEDRGDLPPLFAVKREKVGCRLKPKVEVVS